MNSTKKAHNSTATDTIAANSRTISSVTLYNSGNGAQFARQEPPPLSHPADLRRHSARLPLLRFYAADVTFSKHTATRPKNAANFDSAAFFVQSCAKVAKSLHGANGGLLRLFAFSGMVSVCAASASDRIGA